MTSRASPAPLAVIIGQLLRRRWVAHVAVYEVCTAVRFQRAVSAEDHRSPAVASQVTLTLSVRTPLATAEDLRLAGPRTRGVDRVAAGPRAPPGAERQLQLLVGPCCTVSTECVSHLEGILCAISAVCGQPFRASGSPVPEPAERLAETPPGGTFE